MLPRLVRLAVIDGFLQSPQPGTRRVAHSNKQICNMELLSEVDRQVDLVVLHAPGKWRTLPPVLRSVDGIFRRVAFVRVTWFTYVANLSLDNLVLVLLIVLGVGSN